MYNRYLQNKEEKPMSCDPSSRDRKPMPCDPPSRERKPMPCEERCDTQKKETSSLVSMFSRLLGSDHKGGLSQLLDDNTLIVLLLLFFLLKDEDGIDHDLLILAGIFLLIGL